VGRGGEGRGGRDTPILQGVAAPLHRETNTRRVKTAGETIDDGTD
jgi:hypothetical protein